MPTPMRASPRTRRPPAIRVTSGIDCTTNIPLHQGGIWLQYSLPSGWRFGAGAFAANNRWGNNENTFKIGDYIRVDTNVSYSWDTGFGKATAQFNVTNLFDERYYASATYTP